MKNMKVSMKLLVSFLIVALLTVAVGVTGAFGLLSMGSAADIMYSKKAVPITFLAQASEGYMNSLIQIRSAILYSGDTEKLRTIDSDINQCLQQVEQNMNNYYPTIESEIGKQLFDDISRLLASFKPEILSILEHSKQGYEQSALLSELDRISDTVQALSGDLASLVGARMEIMASAKESNLSTQRQLLIAIIVVILLAVIASMGFAQYLSRAISFPLTNLITFMNKASTTGDIALEQKDLDIIGKLAQVQDEIGQSVNSCAGFVGRVSEVNEILSQVADGDLTSLLPLLSDRDTMGLSLQKMINNLNGMLSEIDSAANQVSSGASQIANVAQILAQGATEQASSIEGLSTTLNDIALETKNKAENGTGKMNQMVNSVEEINQSSNEISKIISVIDNIAFQTNILALNASVEAARAGIHGKGFAVVAEEVKNLANRSQEAARETNQLIANSLKLADDGMGIARETQSALESIVTTIDKLNEVMNGIEQISIVVQQNSATAQESAAASEQMSSQSGVVRTLVGKFRLMGHDSFALGERRLGLPAASLQMNR